MPLRSDAYTMNYFGKLYILKLLTTYINKQKGNMTDQTRPEIEYVQTKNKDRLYLATSLEVKTNKLNKLKDIYTSTSQLDNISEELKKQFDDIILGR